MKQIMKLVYNETINSYEIIRLQRAQGEEPIYEQVGTLYLEGHCARRVFWHFHAEISQMRAAELWFKEFGFTITYEYADTWLLGAKS